MKNVYMTEYKVKGIKTLDETVALSFYKKTITKPIDTQEYNIKGIYGMNGSGKSGIAASVDIVRKLLTYGDYLNNQVVQDYLDAIINKVTKRLWVSIDYLMDNTNDQVLYNYKVVLGKNISDKYIIESESLSAKPAFSRKEVCDPLIEVKDGELTFVKNENNDLLNTLIKKKTINLLSTSSVSTIFWDNIFIPGDLQWEAKASNLFLGLFSLSMLGRSVYVYMDQSDDHTDFLLNKAIQYSINSVKGKVFVNPNRRRGLTVLNRFVNEFVIGASIIPEIYYEQYEKNVKKLRDFIQIFKPDLIRIDIDKKEDKGSYICNLVMVYESYSVDTEFESTGIKKLIKLFGYIKAMVEGKIVFIDEFDSNLHDVYLCALLEYLMDYGQGQLCFTTHNVGPMDVLKRHKKSIDFLSIDHKVYPWIKNGNYSPSNLYRSGMIEGSPFNVEAINFIGIFDSPEEDDK